VAATPPDPHDRRHLERLNAFSDGVFAIAITLLVLTIEVPKDDVNSLSSALSDLGPNIAAYFIGFAVIGLFWYGHSNMFSYLSHGGQPPPALDDLIDAVHHVGPGHLR
jgi:uncharacterized membrane protein